MATADALVDLATSVLADLADPRAGVAPGLELPATLAGHRVDADAHADLVFTLGLLLEAGVETVGGLPVEELLHERLAAIDADRTHTFFSYRVAETAARLGGLDVLAPATRDVVAAAADSTAWLPLLDEGVLPRNYAVVLARCELARAALGLDVDPTVVDRLLARVAALLSESPEGWLDDSNDGRGQVDMYTVDAYLFAAPFADRLGVVWERGLASAARLVEAVVTLDGAALPWGRSIGALAVCHSAELAGLLLRREAETRARARDAPTAAIEPAGGTPGAAIEPTGDAPTAAAGPAGDAPAADIDRDRWWAVARAATAGAAGWFDGGLVVAHKRRSPFRYRGPFRRLQMTLDCAGKLVTAALDLRRVGDEPSPIPWAAAFPSADEWLAFGDGIGVWTRRDPRLGFALPVVGGPGADYAPTPRSPARFEVPTDQPLVCFVPVAWRGEARYAPGGRTAGVRHAPGELDLTHDAWPATAAAGGGGNVAGTAASAGDRPDALSGRRTARYRVDGRTLHIDEDLRFADRPPGALTVLVPETRHQPLRVTAAGSPVRRVTTVDVDGLAEWRSVDGELARVHQVELDPAADVRFRWSVTSKLRVVSSASHHAYHQCLYASLADRVDVRPVPYHLLDDPERLASALATADVVHLHWPEWLTGTSPRRARRVADTLRAIGVPVVWTQHNLAPHTAPDDGDLYRPWADTAAAVIHHSDWGRRAIAERYDFAPGAVHRVIPHGHWGPLMTGLADVERADAEAELGLAATGLRIGLVGAPRPGKQTQLLIDAVHASRREDVQLLVLCHDGEDVPDDPRITALPYAEVPRATYDRRLATLDVLALPLDGASYLTTGQAADAVGAGLPALVSPWPYLREVLGDAAIPYGRTAADLTATIDALDDATLARARAAIPARREALDWAAAGEATWELLDEVAARADPRPPPHG
jgi:glycosyltransferase involved in cell wall biosynthesis